MTDIGAEGSLPASVRMVTKLGRVSFNIFSGEVTQGKGSESPEDYGGYLPRHPTLPITANWSESRGGKGVANRSYSHCLEGLRNYSGFCGN